MKKRIGSRIYDTDTSELICSIDGGSLYRKRSRDREWFAAFDSGEIRPLDPYDPLDVLLMETGHLPPEALEAPEPAFADRIRVDPETHEKIRTAAKAQGISMAAVVRNLARSL